MGFGPQIPRAHPATTGSRPGPCHYVFPQGTRPKKRHPRASFLQTIASQTHGHCALWSCKKPVPNYRAELRFLRLAIGTRITGASQAAVVSTTEARASKPQGTARFDHARNPAQPELSQKPQRHTNHRSFPSSSHVQTRSRGFQKRSRRAQPDLIMLEAVAKSLPFLRNPISTRMTTVSFGPAFRGKPPKLHRQPPSNTLYSKVRGT